MKFVHKNGLFLLGDKTYIMGILNITPDSFYDGGLYNAPDKALAQAKKMVSDGADVIDVGANSTRPGADVLSPEEELKIVKQFIPFLTENVNAVFSIDTFYPEVADFALKNGVSIVNDVSGVFNEKMAEVVKKHKCGWVIMYKGSLYDKGSGTEGATEFFNDILQKCNSFGIPCENIMLDPGIGFGLGLCDDIDLIRNTTLIKNKECAYLVALSNKRVIKSTSKAEGEDRIYGTLAANVLAAAGGADFVRVHNVRENRFALNTADKIIRGKNG